MEKLRLFKSKKTGQILELIGQEDYSSEDLVELVANSVDAAKEKHVPEVKVIENLVSVQVGSVLHPMLPEHYIEFIILVTNLGTHRKNLKPGDTPEATFTLASGEKPLQVYELCNLHGLWVKDL